MSIVISKSGRGAVKLDKITVESEDYLQQYIHHNPESLPLDEYKEDLQLLILAREFPTGSGPIDALGVDQDGEIYLIETKLYRNSDKRQVLAQVLDYGASLWTTYGDPEEFIIRLQEMVSKQFGVSLGEKLEETYGSPEWDHLAYLEAIRDNIQAGSFRFVVLMDRLEERLRDLITFMNHNSRFDVFGVELEFYRHDDLEILIPKLFGAEVKKSVGGSSGSSTRRKWDRESFFEDAASRLPPEDLEAVRRLYAWAEQADAQLSWGTGAKRGSFSPKFEQVSESRSILSVFSDGELWVNTGWLRDFPESRPYAEQLGERLRNELRDLSIPPDYMEKSVGIPIEKWRPNVVRFLEIVDEVVSGNGRAAQTSLNSGGE